MVFDGKLGGGGKINPSFPCVSYDFQKVLKGTNKL